jgi:hypothetical protein
MGLDFELPLSENVLPSERSGDLALELGVVCSEQCLSADAEANGVLQRLVAQAEQGSIGISKRGRNQTCEFSVRSGHRTPRLHARGLTSLGALPLS